MAVTLWSKNGKLISSDAGTSLLECPACPCDGMTISLNCPPSLHTLGEGKPFSITATYAAPSASSVLPSVTIEFDYTDIASDVSLVAESGSAALDFTTGWTGVLGTDKTLTFDAGNIMAVGTIFDDEGTTRDCTATITVWDPADVDTAGNPNSPTTCTFPIYDEVTCAGIDMPEDICTGETFSAGLTLIGTGATKLTRIDDSNGGLTHYSTRLSLYLVGIDIGENATSTWTDGVWEGTGLTNSSMDTIEVSFEEYGQERCYAELTVACCTGALIWDVEVAAGNTYTINLYGRISAVDWGDGTTPTTRGSSSIAYYTASHTYPTGGTYTITITGDVRRFGHSSANRDFPVLARTFDLCSYTGTPTTAGNYSGFYDCDNLQSIADGCVFGPAFTSGEYMFSRSSLKSISSLIFPSSVGGNFSSYAMFEQCLALKSISSLMFPSSVGGNFYSSNMFYNCNALPSISDIDFPSSVGGDFSSAYMFYYCFSLTSISDIEFPSSVGGNFSTTAMFYWCDAVTYINNITLPDTINGVISMDSWLHSARYKVNYADKHQLYECTNWYPAGIMPPQWDYTTTGPLLFGCSNLGSASNTYWDPASTSRTYWTC